MAYEKILVAYDRSDYSKLAFDAALEMVEYGLAKEIIVLYATETYRGADPELEATGILGGIEVVTEAQIEYEEVHKEIKRMAYGFEKRVEVIIRVGSPKDEILKIASGHKCGLIVMGSRGLGAIQGMLGSVSLAVLRDSDIPVFIVK